MRDKTRKYIVNQTANELNTGHLLVKYFLAHRTRKAALARALNRDASSIMNYQKNATIQTAILWEISHVLKHNFFKDIAVTLPSDFTTYAPIESQKDERIAELETQLLQAQTERNILLEAMKKG